MKEFLIIGHGLAGSVIAHKLTALGYKVTVFDNQLPHSASNVSVSLVNPLIGPKLNAPEKLYHVCQKIIISLAPSKKFGEINFTNLFLYRVFKSETQRKLWIKKQKISKLATTQEIYRIQISGGKKISLHLMVPD